MHARIRAALALVLGVPVALRAGGALAAPSEAEILDAAPTLETKAPEATRFQLGDWGVAEQTGAATYRIPITVPPGRSGMAPKLALSYSSRAPLRGGIAAGWSLDLPSIQRDTSGGTLGEERYAASLGGASGRLIKVPDFSAAGAPPRNPKATGSAVVKTGSAAFTRSRTDPSLNRSSCAVARWSERGTSRLPVAPIRMPLGLSRKKSAVGMAVERTVPSIREGSPPVTRAITLASGGRFGFGSAVKLALSPIPTLNRRKLWSRFAPSRQPSSSPIS